MATPKRNVDVEALAKTLDLLVERIRENADVIAESKTRTRVLLVEPLLRALGWDPANPEQAARDIPVEDGVVDYALLAPAPDGEASVVAHVDVSALGDVLDGAHEEAAARAAAAGVRYVVVTDGDWWEAHDLQGEADEYGEVWPFLQIGITDEDAVDCAVTMLQRLTELAGEVAIAPRVATKLLRRALRGKALPHVVVRLLDAGADPTRRDASGLTPLSEADDGGRTALHVAARHYDSAAAVERLIALGADVDARDAYGDTPLHGLLAPFPTIFRNDVTKTGVDWERKTPTVDVLVRHGADVNARKQVKATPLHHAVGQGTGDLRIVLACLERHGADFTARTRLGWTALHVGTLRGVDVGVLALLLQGGAVRARLPAGETPLHLAAGRIIRVPLWSVADATAPIEFLLENGADVEARAAYGATPLHFVADRGPEDWPGVAAAMARVLLERGADLRAQNVDGRTPFQVAAAHGGSDELLRLLRV